MQRYATYLELNRRETNRQQKYVCLVQLYDSKWGQNELWIGVWQTVDECESWNEAVGGVIMTELTDRIITACQSKMGGVIETNGIMAAEADWQVRMLSIEMASETVNFVTSHMSHSQ